jgi:hypothetical protein
MATMQQMDTIVRRALRCRYNVGFLSQPALGKTYKLNEIATSLQTEDPTFFFEHIDCGTLAPTDLVMSMPDMVEKDIARLVDGRLPNAYKLPNVCGLIYWGEWMLAGLEVNRGLQKLINHEDCGGFRLPHGIINVMDGNRQKDRSGAQTQSRALMSRIEVWELEYDPEYALSVMKVYHERVAAFAIRNPGCIDNYSDIFENDKREGNDLGLVEGKRGVWANLRSWDRVSRKMRDADETGIGLIPGEVEVNVGSGIAATFHAFCAMLDKLATLEEIIAKPDKVDVPSKMDEQYALSTMLALLVNKDSFTPISVYMNRYRHEIQTVFFRTMNDRLARQKDGNASAIKSSKEYKTWITSKHISDLLRGASAQ